MWGLRDGAMGEALRGFFSRVPALSLAEFDKPYELGNHDHVSCPLNNYHVRRRHGGLVRGPPPHTGELASVSSALDLEREAALSSIKCPVRAVSRTWGLCGVRLRLMVRFRHVGTVYYLNGYKTSDKGERNETDIILPRYNHELR